MLIKADSQVRFIPVENYNGTPVGLEVHAIDSSSTLTYTVEDDKRYFDTTSDDTFADISAVSDAPVTLTITINPVNDNPTAKDDLFSTNEDSTIVGNLLADNGNGVDFDIDGDSPLEVIDISTLNLV